MKKKIFGIITSIILLIGMMPSAVFATGISTGGTGTGTGETGVINVNAEYDLKDGSITITSTINPYYPDKLFQLVQQNGKKVTHSKPITVYSSETQATKNTVTIISEENTRAEVKLSGVNIDVISIENQYNAGLSYAAVITKGEGDVEIGITGTNTLKSGWGHAGIEKNNSGTLTIGTWTSTSDNSLISTYYNGLIN